MCIRDSDKTLWLTLVWNTVVDCCGIGLETPKEFLQNNAISRMPTEMDKII